MLTVFHLPASPFGKVLAAMVRWSRMEASPISSVKEIDGWSRRWQLAGSRPLEEGWEPSRHHQGQCRWLRALGVHRREPGWESLLEAVP